MLRLLLLVLLLPLQQQQSLAVTEDLDGVLLQDHQALHYQENSLSYQDKAQQSAARSHGVLRSRGLGSGDPCPGWSGPCSAAPTSVVRQMRTAAFSLQR
jgi:hypothetical protein